MLQDTTYMYDVVLGCDLLHIPEAEVMRTDKHIFVQLMGCTCIFLIYLYFFSGIYGGLLLKVHDFLYKRIS